MPAIKATKRLILCGSRVGTRTYYCMIRIDTRGSMKDGLLPVYKPTEISSYDVIRNFKRLTQYRGKIGHAGTLDPFADGVLILMLGKSTKKFDEIQAWKKEYLAVSKLGAKSATLDTEGEIELQEKVPEINKASLQKILRKQIGKIEQVVPIYSATKHKGKPLYSYAREGESVPVKKKWVEIFEIDGKIMNQNKIELRILCSSGTYIRQLSFDIFRELGIDSHLISLTRTKIGKVGITQCCKLTDFGAGWEKYLISN